MSPPTLEAKRLSKWYGPVLGLSEINWSVDGGVVGLLGPNGAGKSTFMKMCVGLMRPSRGQLRVFGADPFSNVAVRARIGYAPEHEHVFPELLAIEFVTYMARLAGVSKPKDAAEKALVDMGLEKAMGRSLDGFSKGMRQRAKLASCLIHDPDFIVLDEPLTGIDPVERKKIVDRIQMLGDAGKTVLVSSHVLYEIEKVTREIMVIYRGQVLAEGNLREIRGLIDKHPHRIRVECSAPRKLAKLMADAEHLLNIQFADGEVTFETDDPDACYQLIAQTSLEHSLSLRSMTSQDNNLTAVFDYLTGGHR